MNLSKQSASLYKDPLIVNDDDQLYPLLKGNYEY